MIQYLSIFTIIALSLVGCATTPKWDRGEKLLAAGVLAANAADVVTTQNAIDRGAVEANPFYGPNPSNGRLVLTKAISSGVVLLAAEMMPSHGWRKAVLGVGVAVPMAAAIHNSQVGK